MGFFLQLGVLLWKNFTLRKRQPVRVVVEIVWPLVLFLILVAVRFRPDVRKNIEECHYAARAMPSAGTWAFLSSYLCNFNNQCQQNISQTDIPGAASNSSLMKIFLNDFETVLSDNVDPDQIVRLVKDISLLEELFEAVANASVDVGTITIRLADVLLSRQNLTLAMANQNISLSNKSLDALLDAPLDLQKVLAAIGESNRTRLEDLVTFVSDVLQSQAANFSNASTSEEIRNITCDSKILFEFLDFENGADVTDLQNQLCNLSSAEFSQLREIIYRGIDRGKLISEITNIVFNVTRKMPNFDLQLWMSIPQIIRDLNRLSSLNVLLQDVSSIVSAASSASANSTNNSSSSLMSVLSSFMCGGSTAILGLVNGSQTNLPGNTKQQGRQDPFSSAEFQNKKERYESRGISSECASLFASFQNERVSRMLWWQLEPIVLGEISYAPDSPASRKIIQEANRTFDSIADIFVLVESVQNLIPQLENFLETNISAVRNFFGSPVCKNTIYMLKTVLPSYQQSLPTQFGNTIANLNESVCQEVSEFLGLNDSSDGAYTWRRALNNTRDLISSVQPYFQCFNLNKFVGYPNSSSLVEVSLNNIENNTFWTAVMFDNVALNDTQIPSLIKYRIRMDTDRVDNTKRIASKYWRPGNRGSYYDLKYWLFGFIYIQDMIDHAIIRLQTNSSQEPGIYTHQFPYGCYVYDRFTFAISRSLPLFMVISWIYTVAMIIKGIVYEKEQRLKEVMKIMGLGNGVHWLAWFINAFVMMVITVIIFVIILKAGKVLEYSDPSVVFVFMLAFTVSTISQCFLISVFFNKANLAAVCGGFVYFVLYLPYTQLVQWEDSITTTERILASLSSNIAMGYGCSYLSQFEEQTVGAQWHNIGESPMVDDTFNLRTCMGMMFLDSAIYLLVTWYIEAVFPGQYGMPRKWYFLVQKSYWCGHTASSKYRNRIDSEMPIDDVGGNNEHFEKDPTGVKVGVAVRNLRKIYNKGDKVAVDGLSINFYEGQITSFLGHNGAGKTTTMSILTGLFPPTSGTAYINGQDILSDMDQIRHSLGMCPQHNVLFDLLTVEEHIWFYARLKGTDSADIKSEMEQIIQDVKLPHKRKEKSKNLSGGMKRKLSVAIAFVGGSRTVILDEPTAGVDPYARRAIWELLLKFRKDRTIILSTHHMDEADVLGDRIAIISHGKLCTVGTSLFLKNRYGSGYYLTLVRQDAQEADHAGNGCPVGDPFSQHGRPSSATSIRTVMDVEPALMYQDEGHDVDGFDVDGDDVDGDLFKPSKDKMVQGYNVCRLTAFIQKFVPGAVLVEDNSMEVCYRLPESDSHAEKYQKLFAALEKSYANLGISSYGISDTSLEEVFLKVAEESSVEDHKKSKNKKKPKQKEVFQNGRYQHEASALSRRSRTHTSLFKLNYRNRVNSSERLTADTDDTESVSSEVLEAPQEINFSSAGEVHIKGKRLLAHQLFALFLKRFHHVRRSKKGFISEILLPAGFVCLAMVFALITPSFSEEPALELQPWMYEPKKGDSSLYTFYSNDNPSSPTSQTLETNLQAAYYGTRCMNSSLYVIKGKACEHSSNTSHWTPQLTLADINSPACSCDSGFQRCPDEAGGPEPSMLRIRTHDRLYNTTGRNISDWLVKTVDKYQKRRYGGFSLGEESRAIRVNATQVSSFIDRFVQEANNNQSIFSGTEQFWENLESVLKFAFTEDNVKVWFNNKGWAASVSYMNAMNNLILRTLLPPGKDPQQYGIVTFNHPMNLTKQQLNEETLYNSAVDVVVAICVIFAMSFVPASFVLFLIEERVSNSKHLQFVSGIKPVVYWLANWTWDMINYAIPAMLCIFIFLAFGKESYVSAKNFPCLFALLFLYGWAITPMMYPFSRMFDVPSSAFVFLSCINVFLGTVSTLATFILELLSQDDPELKNTNDILKQVFLLLPHYCLGRGLIDMASLQLQSDVRARLGDSLTYNLFDWMVVGRNLFAMIMLGVLFNILNLLIEYRFFLSWSCLSKTPASKVKHEDIDVAKERQRVVSGGAKEDIMRLEGLTKVYWTPGKKGKMTAVDHLYVGIPKGQCFGLLGVNGAGKTTTFKMLTGDQQVTEGDAFINQYSIRKKMVQVRQFMGYCPQFDALDPLLTGREHLQFYARVRGISPKDIKSVADWVIKRLGLSEHGDKISSDYSGGNKRKLSTAIALIGNPPIIFLDEPTTGMDPGARRFLWNCINSIVKSGHSVILTSHSMEECEALCNRLAIMVNGTFQCLGSIQHLKSRFGNGYTIILRVSLDMNPVMEFISSSFPSAKLREKHHNMLQYQLGSECLSLSKIFQVMEEAKRAYSVEDYSVSQTTLDQVFISFAKKQTDLLDDELDKSGNYDDDDMDNEIDDNTSTVLNAGTEFSDLPSQFDEQSMTGSFIELIRPGNGRTLDDVPGSTVNNLANVSII